MRIAIIIDAWKPQVNGVVTTLSTVGRLLREQGDEVLFVTTKSFRTMPCPTYPSIRLALLPGREVTRMLVAFQPERIHIATEGPLGLAARRYCVRFGFNFSTSFHTRFPEYIRLRAPVPVSWPYRFLRWFHAGPVS